MRACWERPEKHLRDCGDKNLKVYWRIAKYHTRTDRVTSWAPVGAKTKKNHCIKHWKCICQFVEIKQIFKHHLLVDVADHGHQVTHLPRPSGLVSHNVTDQLMTCPGRELKYDGKWIKFWFHTWRTLSIVNMQSNSPCCGDDPCQPRPHPGPAHGRRLCAQWRPVHPHRAMVRARQIIQKPHLRLVIFCWVWGTWKVFAQPRRVSTNILLTSAYWYPSSVPRTARPWCPWCRPLVSSSWGPCRYTRWPWRKI